MQKCQYLNLPTSTIWRSTERRVPAGALGEALFSLIILMKHLSLRKIFHDGTLKWKSQEITKANTIQASKKFKNRWPCQKFRVSDGCTDAADEAAVAASFASFHCSIISASLAPATLRAMDPQISQVLPLIF